LSRSLVLRMPFGSGVHADIHAGVRADARADVHAGTHADLTNLGLRCAISIIIRLTSHVLADDHSRRAPPVWFDRCRPYLPWADAGRSCIGRLGRGSGVLALGDLFASPGPDEPESGKKPP
jgi:hypothetical protein